MTSLEPDDENFDIAQQFIRNKFDNNSFGDTNEHMVAKQFKN